MKNSYTLQVILEPAEDLPGVWTTHCLDFDVVSQGNSPSNALDMIFEAVCLLAEPEEEQGKTRKKALVEDWEKALTIMQSENTDARVVQMTIVPCQCDSKACEHAAHVLFRWFNSPITWTESPTIWTLNDTVRS